MLAPALPSRRAGQRFVTFTVGGQLFGVDIETVQEVLGAQVTTTVPLAAACADGLMNLRGEVVTALDLRRRLGLPERPDGTLPMNVVVRTRDGAVSLVVDTIGEVVVADQAQFEATPDTVPATTRELLSGAYKLDSALLLVLDVPRVVEI